ncbi:hypothetical protein PHK61_31095 [Actinomycetospora lutea]|uniref:hypothetical protein n=1 Tax=Actinomycetospora lutea TaxID=663604 RepID=UPI0023660A69|nr:hypothetical protein [Actinomycetospora lutea]MDD7942868.1 hypothetical protein [Actinomycetospora lutea]
MSEHRTENELRPSNGATARSQSTEHLHDDLKEEYYKLTDIVTSFDQRLLTIKGWGVTFSLATLALGFQQNHYGLFLVAAASALSFWVIEGSVKLHQMRYYPRMGDIEVAAFDLYRGKTDRGPVSAPLIDWSWHTGWTRVKGGASKGDPRVPTPWDDVNDNPGRRPFLFPHVAFPHAIVLALGALFFVLGLAGQLGPI